jgi:hypothetical protein
MRFDIKVDRGSFFVVSKLGEPEYSDIRASLPENELKIVDNFSDIVARFFCSFSGTGITLFMYGIISYLAYHKNILMPERTKELDDFAESMLQQMFVLEKEYIIPRLFGGDKPLEQEIAEERNFFEIKQRFIKNIFSEFKMFYLDEEWAVIDRIFFSPDEFQPDPRFPCS